MSGEERDVTRVLILIDEAADIPDECLLVDLNPRSKTHGVVDIIQTRRRPCDWLDGMMLKEVK